MYLQYEVYIIPEQSACKDHEYVFCILRLHVMEYAVPVELPGCMHFGMLNSEQQNFSAQERNYVPMDALKARKGEGFKGETVFCGDLMFCIFMAWLTV